MHYFIVSKIQWKPFGLPRSSVHKMTGLGGKMVLMITYTHRSHCSFSGMVSCVFACVAMLIGTATPAMVEVCLKWYCRCCRVPNQLQILTHHFRKSTKSSKTKTSYILPWTKKRTIIEIRGEKNAVPHVISCSIRRDQRRAKVADSRGSDLPELIAPDRA